MAESSKRKPGDMEEDPDINPKSSRREEPSDSFAKKLALSFL
jgi:hypothetical protein